MKKNLVLTIACLFAMHLVLLAQVPSYVATNGLVGWWPFNGNANDESGNGNNGTVNGASLATNRFNEINKAYSFNGTSDYISCLNSGPTGNPNFTISFWVNTQSPNPSSQIIGWGTSQSSAGGEFRVLVNHNCPNGIAIDTYQSASNFNSSFNNSWDFYTVISDSSVANNVTNTKIYKNGTLISSNCYTANVASTNIQSQYGITFGRDHGASFAFFNGTLDDIGIWNRVLTQQEISDLFNAVNCTLSVSTQPANQTTAIGSSATFTTSTNDPSATYQWQTNLGLGFQNLGNAGQYNGANNDTLTVSNVNSINNNQSFRCIISSGNCIDTTNTATLTISSANAIADKTKHTELSLFPNPASNQLNIQIGEPYKEKSFTILDTNGRVVLQGLTKASSTNIDLRNLNNGLYVLVLEDGTQKVFQIVR